MALQSRSCREGGSLRRPTLREVQKHTKLLAGGVSSWAEAPPPRAVTGAGSQQPRQRNVVPLSALPSRRAFCVSSRTEEAESARAPQNCLPSSANCLLSSSFLFFNLLAGQDVCTSMYRLLLHRSLKSKKHFLNTAQQMHRLPKQLQI